MTDRVVYPWAILLLGACTAEPALPPAGSTWTADSFRLAVDIEDSRSAILSASPAPRTTGALCNESSTCDDGYCDLTRHQCSGACEDNADCLGQECVGGSCSTANLGAYTSVAIEVDALNRFRLRATEGTTSFDLDDRILCGACVMEDTDTEFSCASENAAEEEWPGTPRNCDWKQLEDAR